MFNALPFAEQHWIIGCLFASALWFLAGYQSLANRQPIYAMFWQGIGFFIATVSCVFMLLKHEWVGLAFGFIAVGIEGKFFMRSYSAWHGKH